MVKGVKYLLLPGFLLLLITSISIGKQRAIYPYNKPLSPTTNQHVITQAGQLNQLKNILEEYGISEILESVDGKRRIVPDKVQCDLYDYFAGKTDLFKGSYLSNYSWGETTLAELSGQYLSR